MPVTTARCVLLAEIDKIEIGNAMITPLVHERRLVA